MANSFISAAAIAAALSVAPLKPANAEPVALPSASQTVPAAASSSSVAERITDVISPSIVASAQQQPTMSDDDLGDFRGSGGLVVGNQTLNAISSGNSTIAAYTAGSVSLSDLALSNFNGLGNITVNTGALSQLQSAMNITVNINP